MGRDGASCQRLSFILAFGSCDDNLGRLHFYPVFIPQQLRNQLQYEKKCFCRISIVANTNDQIVQCTKKLICIFFFFTFVSRNKNSKGFLINSFKVHPPNNHTAYNMKNHNYWRRKLLFFRIPDEKYVQYGMYRWMVFQKNNTIMLWSL